MVNIVESLEDIFGIPYFSHIIPVSDQAVMKVLDIKKYNAVVAGGCALAWYQQQSVGHRDIDIWFPDQTSFDQMSNHLKSQNHRLAYNSNDAETFKVSLTPNDLYRVQLIKARFFQNPTNILDNFDISVCQIATDGNTWWVGKDFVQDLKNRRLRIIKHHPGIAKRMLKYWTYGFHPNDQDLQMIIDNPESNWDFATNTDEEYANAI